MSESEALSAAAQAAEGKTPREAATEAPPDLVEAARRLMAEGGETAIAAGEAASALSALVEAELALARAAAPRALFAAVLAFGLGLVSALYALALLVAWLQRLGLDWFESLAVAFALAAAATAGTIWQSLRLWRMTRFEATRRQLADLLGRSP
jgi:uncharacterized membrane protein YqjE